MYKQLLQFKTFLLVCLLAMVGTSNAWGVNVTYKLTINSNDFNTTSYAANNNEKTSNAVCTTDNQKTYEVKWTSNQVMKFGTNMQWQKNKGYIYNSTDMGTITKVTVTSSAGSFTTYYGTSEQPSSGTTVGGGFFKTNVGNANGTTSKVEITFVISEEGSTPSIPTCATPTFSLPEGNYTSAQNVTLSTATDGATIYYTTDGTDPTTSSTVYSDAINVASTTTIKAIAVKSDYEDSEVATAAYTIKQVVSGYTIDFESTLDCYSDWEITNAEQATGSITAHGGTHYGTTGGKATASIQTKEPLALPGTFTCYISKQSGNTTSSTWKIQVSSDGSNWTDVKENSATMMNAGNWMEFTADLSQYSNVYVRLYYTGSTAIRNVDDISITMRDPNAKVTPTVTINATGLTTNDIAGSTNVSAGTLTATVTSGETTITSTAVTWSSDEPSVATVNASTGAVTLIAAGTATITATFAGNDDYTEASATYELTVINSMAKGGENNPYTVAEARAAIDAETGTTGVYVTGTVSEIVTEYNSQYHNISYNISADGETTSDQLEVFRGKSYNGDNFTSASDIKVGDVVVVYGNLTKYNDTYEFEQNSHLVSLEREKSAAVIPVKKSVEVVYGNTFTIDDSKIESGDITVTSSNTAVATVSGLTITPIAVGTATITVTTAENEYYYAGNASFELTVTAPEGKTTAPATGFVKVTSTSDITDGQYLIVYEEGSVAFDGGLETLDAAHNKIGVEINNGKIAATENNKAAAFTIDVAAGTIKSASGKYIGVSSNSNGLKTTEDASAYKNSFSIENGEAIIAAAFESSTMTLRFNSTNDNSNDRFRYYKSGQKAIQLYKLSDASLTAKLNASGYATYCSEYPLDFSEATDYSAWQITDIDDSNNITFEKITGNIKGGTGLFLMGTANATITLASVNSSTELSDNLLEGTLAPTYFAQDAIYGLAGASFYKNNAGTFKANKAYIPAGEVSSNVRAFTFVFVDPTTGITETQTVSAEQFGEIFNLAGQRIGQPQKGVNIINGKKVLVK